MNRATNILAGLLSAVFIVTFTGTGTAFAADSVRIIDDGDPGFSVNNPAQWFHTAHLGFNADYLSGIGTGAAATWSFTVNPGSYRVSITWYNAGAPYNASYSAAAPISVLLGQTVMMSGTLNLRTTPADRTDAGVGWKDLGVFNVTSAPLQVRLSAVATAYVMADAVRIERIDGTPITAPTISATVPLNSPLTGGLPVTIRGSQFVSGTRVLFGTKASPQVTLVSSTELTAVSPSNAPGVVDITVITPQNLSAVLPATFKYAVGRTLDDGEVGFTASAPASTTIQLGFQNDYVQPGGVASAATASWSMLVNKQPSQRVAVTWYNAGAPYNAIYSNDVRFDVMDDTNVLAVIVGNLQQTPNDFTDLGRGWKQLGYFAFPSGKLKVVLRNNTAKLLMADAIRVEETFPAPVLTAITPNKGLVAGGTSVVLSGSNFLEGATVKFGSLSAKTVTFTSNTSLTAVTPASVSGTVAVTVTNPDGKSASLANAFAFQTTLSLQAFITPRFPITEPETPQFAIAKTDGTIVISWPAASAGYLVEETAALGPMADWTPVTGEPAQTGGQNSVSITMDGPAKFYRLRGRDAIGR